MDFENVKKSEKSKSSHWFHRYAFLFRLTEIGAALLFFCWLFSSLPFAVKISAEFFRRFLYVVSTPLFMFFLGNSIIVALLTTKSAVFSAAGKSEGAETENYDAFIRSGENRANSADGAEEIIYDDKEMIAAVTDSISNSNSTVAREDHEITESVKESDSATDSAKVYRRTKSEMSAKLSSEMVTTKPSLRRSETENYRKIPLDDNLTNEEFQKKIEAFIKKQLIFRRQESHAVVIHNQI